MVVLHLEDSEHDALLVETLLHDEWPACRIRRVVSRAEFESALQFEDFDLILSDHQLPGYDGLSALEQARKQRPEKPFIFISGTIGEERAIEAMKRGADDYVIKDRPARLIPAVRQVMARLEESGRRRDAEEALRQNQERFRQITENVADMIAVLDLTGRRIYNNPAYATVLGNQEPLRSTDSFREIHPEDRERVRQVFFETVRTGIGQRLDYRFLLPDGSLRYIESQGSVIRQANGQVANVLVVSRDVTERRAAELQLQEQASLLDKARDAIIATDLALRVAYWNASAERMYGWKAADVFGRDLRQLGLGFDAERLATAHAQTLEKGEWRGQFQAQSREGARVHIATTWSLVLDPSGQPRSLLMMDTDLTEEKKLETRLLRSQRLESIGTLTGGVAHDLNNVLAPILMGVELLRIEPLSEPAQAILRTMETSAQHGAAMVRQLLDFARGTEGERAMLQPHGLLEQLAPLLRQMLPRRITIEVSSKPDLFSVVANATQLKQIVLNLCINGSDAIKDSGTITIVAENMVVDESLARSIPDGSTGPHVRVTVSDSGSGIPPAILDKIFDPFFTTKDVGKGTGLGLSTVRGIVKGHGGFLHVESTVGLGTTFHIFLPAAVKVVAAVPTNAALRGNGETILVVDGDASGREMLRPFLEHHGYQALVARDDCEALELHRQHRREIAAVVIDISGSRSTLIAALRVIDPTLPIVAISAGADVGGPPIAPPFVNLAKPVEPPQILSALSEVLPKKSSRPPSRLV